jgi:hypothetical protein
VLLHGRDPATGKALPFRRALALAGYSDDRSGCKSARRDLALPHVQAAYLDGFAALLTASLAHGLGTLLVVQRGSRSNMARVAAVREVLKLFQSLVQERRDCGLGFRLHPARAKRARGDRSDRCR